MFELFFMVFNFLILKITINKKNINIKTSCYKFNHVSINNCKLL